jgi:hypothetical protein
MQWQQGRIYVVHRSVRLNLAQVLLDAHPNLVSVAAWPAARLMARTVTWAAAGGGVAR